MTIRKVLRAGHPTLRTENEPYSKSRIGSPEFDRLVHDLFETMHDYDGVGLAAPQVQKNVRLLVYEIRETDRYEDVEEPIGPAVLVNPEVVELSGETVEDWEGCLSYPDLRGLVPRYESVRVRYLDRSGDERTRDVEGFEARVLQHEIDHLNGRLFVERMDDLDSLCFYEEYLRYHDENE